MPRNSLGWDYPAGAEHDPAAPWNQPDALPCPKCDSLATLEDGNWPADCHDWYCEDCGHEWTVVDRPAKGDE